MLRSFPLVGAAEAAAAGPDALEGSSDAALVAAAIGDADAFRPLYDCYIPPMVRYLTARTGSPDLAAELTQAAMVQAWSRLDTYRADRIEDLNRAAGETSTQEVTVFELNVVHDPETFVYRAPAGVTVVEVTDNSSMKDAISGD